MTKRMVIMLIAVAIVLGGVFGFQAFKGVMIKKFMAGMASPPQTVSAAKAGSSQWQPQIEAVGSLRALNGADLSLEVSGIVDSLSFKSGDDVKQGDVLLRLRSEDDVAKLQSLQAVADLNQITYDRDQKQFQMQAVSQANIDTDVANLKNAKAQVAQQQAILDKKTLRAPFSGHIGIRAVDLGQYLGAGTVISTLQALDPIYMDFFVPQQAVDQIRVGQRVNVKVDAFKDQTFPGEISAINPKVDLSSRNVQIRATLTNPDHKLLPGMYATVDIATGAPQNLVTLPQTAITYNPYGDTVYIVDTKGNDANNKPQQIARQVFVTTGSTRGDQVAVLKGVNDGDMVVTAGQLKLHNGTVVFIDNSVTPTADATPNVIDR
ncbi:MAG TPA: efflux RND transporter periplasmic adaptor subunit [Xanthobacteraceae bacterium]|jgi:membrane fusion protein (multidrug efflux system)|nr:efflux RND transporter periplasmic adaptor subunit [Xanthobacteraceae bacterium]